MTRITKSVEERRQEIVDMARKLFTEKGFDNTAISDISKELNIAQGLTYHYFKSKTELLYAVIDEVVKEEVEVKAKIMLEQKGKAIDSLAFFIADKSTARDYYNESFPSLTGDQAIMEYIRRRIATYMEPIVLELIERGNKDGSWSCSHPKETASFIMYGMSGELTSPEDITMTILLKVLGSSNN